MTVAPSPTLPVSDRTHAVRRVLGHLRRRPRTVAVAVLALLLGVSGWCRSNYRDPTYDFHLEGVKDPQQVVELVRLAAELREVKEWDPPSASEAAAGSITDWIRENNPQARTRADLLRASSQPEFAACNGLVQLLPDLSPEDLARWRGAGRDDVVAEIRTIFRDHAAAAREAAYAEILGREKTRVLLGVVPISPYPETPTWSRRTACRLGRKRSPDRELWVRAFIDAAEGQLLDRARKYLSISQSPPHVAGAGEVRFLLKPYASGEGSPAAEPSAGSELEVWLGLERADGPTPTRQEWDTGLRLTSVEWEWDGEPPAGKRLRPHPVRPQWPPAEPPFVLNTAFESFLHGIGLPATVSVRAKGARLSGPRASPTFTVECELSSREFPEWSSPLTLTLAAGAWVETRSEVSRARERARGGLIDHVVGLGQLAGFPADIREIPDGSRDLRIALRCQGVSVELIGSVGADCVLVIGDVPELDSRFELARAVAKAEPKVAGLPVVVRSARVDRDRAEVVIGGVLIGPPGTAATPFTLTFRHDGPTSIALGGPVPSLPDSLEPVRVPLRADAIEAKAREYIGSHFPKLVPHLRVAAVVGSGPAWLRLGLQISDWPAVEIGPFAVNSTDAVPATVERLLTEDSVRRHAASQWLLKDRPARHRRYGPIHSELVSWDARSGLAKIKCSCTAPGFRRLEWCESAQLGPRGWSQIGLDELTRVIEQQLGRLEPGVGVTFLSARHCVVAGVRPDRDAFGPGHWVRLNPLAVAVAADLHLVPLGISVAANGILIDADGIYPPREVSATYMGTFYTPKFCLSDPTVRIGFVDRSLAVSAKFTPPIAGFQKQNAPNAKPPAGSSPASFAGARSGRSREAKGEIAPPPSGHRPAPDGAQLHHAFGLPDDDPRMLRLDNLWLNVLYLQLELKGGLNQLLIQARGRLRVLGSTDVAYGELSCSLESLEQIEVNGELEALTPLPGLGVIPARINGRMHYGSGKGVFECGVRVAVRGHEVSALRLAVSARPGEKYQLRVHGHAEFPGLAAGELKGWAALDMADYDIAGQLRGPLWLVRFRASPAGAEYACSRMTPAGSLGLRICLPRLDGATQSRVEDALAKAGPTSPETERVSPATAQEEQWARERFQNDSPRPAGGGGETAEPDVQKKRDESPAGGGGYVRVRGIVDVTEGEPRMVRFRDKARAEAFGTEGLVFQFPHKEFPIDPSNCRFRYWGSPATKPEVYEILVYDLRAGRLRTIRWDGQRAQAGDLTPHFRGIDLPALKTAEPVPDRLAGPMAVAWDTAETYFRKTLQHGKNVRAPVPVASGFAFSYSPDGGPGHFTVYTWAGSRGICQAEIASPVPDGRRTEQLYRSLEAVFDAENESVIKVVAVHPADHTRFARLVRRDGPVLELPASSGTKRIPVAAGYEPGPLYSQAAACGNAFFAGHEIAGSRLWLGGRGACVEDGDALWVIADHGPAPPSAGRLKRARFDEWSNESARLLPAEWHQRSARVALSWEQVKDKALTDWDRDRLRDGFEAHPLGLLIGLANRP